MVLQIKNLQIALKKDLRELVRDLSLSVEAGDKIAVIGEEGNGKSTLLRLIYEGELPEEGFSWSGEISKKGMILGYLPQQLRDEEKEKTAYEFCCGEEAFLDSSPGELAGAAKKLGFSNELYYASRKMGSLSGGEKVKLQLALLLLRRPDCFLLDEPSGDLDLETLAWLEEFIGSSRAPVIYISHDETLLERTANKILHLEQLRRKTLPRCTVVRCGYREYVETRLRQFAHQEQVAKKERQEERQKQERLQKLYQKVEHGQNSVSRQDPHAGRMLKKKMKAVKSVERRFEREQENRTEVPDTEEAILVSFSPDTGVPAGKTVLDFSLPELRAGEELLSRNISLFVRGGEHVGIIGRNGVGKTTLLRLIAKELLPRKDLRVSYMPQDYSERMDQSLTPVEFLAESGEKSELTRAKTFLGSMKYTAEECEHSLHELSGGQRAKLFLLKMILRKSNVLVLDEPTRNFSPLSGPVIREILEEFPGAILSVSHDRKYLSEVCDVLYELTGSGLHRVQSAEERF